MPYTHHNKNHTPTDKKTILTDQHFRIWLPKAVLTEAE